MLLIQHNDVVQQLTPQCADHPFHERILPGRPRRRYHFLDAQAPQAAAYLFAIGAVAVADEVSAGCVEGKRLTQLLGDPFLTRVGCHVAVDDSRAVAPHVQVLIRKLKDIHPAKRNAPSSRRKKALTPGGLFLQ